MRIIILSLLFLAILCNFQGQFGSLSKRLRFCDHVRTHVHGECCQQFSIHVLIHLAVFLSDWNEKERMVIHQGNLTSDY